MRMAGVKAHAHANAAGGCKTVAGFGRCGKRLTRRLERDEERVSLGVHLDTAMSGDRVTHDPPVRG